MERVARITTTAGRVDGGNIMPTPPTMQNSQVGPAAARPFTSAELDAQSFKVYTTEELDVQWAQHSTALHEVKDGVRQLGENLNDLTKAIDALSKRLDGVEKKDPE